MASKSIERIPVRDEANDHESFVPVGVLDGDDPGPTLTVLGGVHATEYAAQEAVQRFWSELDPGAVAGTVNVVLAADVTALLAHAHHTNPVDGKNLNRVWPGRADGTLTEVIAHTLTTEYLDGADAVVDCHGGEYTERIDLLTLAYRTGDDELDERIRGLAEAVGFPFYVTHAVDSPKLMSETDGRTTSVAAVERGVPSVTLEAGGAGERADRHVGATLQALRNALGHLGMVEGEPVPFAGTPRELGDVAFLSVEQPGLYEAHVTTEQWVEADELVATVRDFDGAVLEEVRSPAAGTVVMTLNSRAIGADDIAAVIGTTGDG